MRFDGQQVVHQPGRELECEIGIVEVRLNPDFRDSSPPVGAEEVPDLGLNAEALAPLGLVALQVLDRRKIAFEFLVLRVETDLDRHPIDAVDMTPRDHLSLVVLTVGHFATKPDLDAPAMETCLQLPEVRRCQRLHRVRDLFEERNVHTTCYDRNDWRYPRNR